MHTLPSNQYPPVTLESHLVSNIPIALLSGDIYESTPIIATCIDVIDRYGITGAANSFLARNIFQSQSNFERAIRSGTERTSESEYRNIVLESDEGFAPSEYVYTHKPGNLLTPLQSMFGVLQGTMVAFYDRAAMIPHSDKKYGWESESLWSFNDKDNPATAIKLILCHNGSFNPPNNASHILRGWKEKDVLDF